MGPRRTSSRLARPFLLSWWATTRLRRYLPLPDGLFLYLKFRNSVQARQMSLGFISSRRRLTTTASLQMGDGERGHVAGNQDDPRPSPPNGTDRASPRASVHSQAHWGLEMELRRPGALAARLLRVVSGSPAAARVLGEEQKSPQFRIPSHRIARVPPETCCRDIKTWSSPVFVSFLGNVDLPKTRLESPHHQFIAVFTYRDGTHPLQQIKSSSMR